MLGKCGLCNNVGVLDKYIVDALGLRIECPTCNEEDHDCFFRLPCKHIHSCSKCVDRVRAAQGLEQLAELENVTTEPAAMNLPLGPQTEVVISVPHHGTYLQVDPLTGRIWQQPRDPTVFLLESTKDSIVLKVAGPPSVPRYIAPLHRQATHLALTSFSAAEAATLQINPAGHGTDGLWVLQGQTPKGVKLLRANCYQHSDKVGITIGTSLPRKPSGWEWFKFETPTSEQKAASNLLLEQYWRQSQRATLAKPSTDACIVAAPTLAAARIHVPAPVVATPRRAPIARRDREAECLRREQARLAQRAAAEAKRDARRDLRR